MKVKITLIVAQQNPQVSVQSNDFLKILVDISNNLPSVYMSTKNEKQTLQELYEKHLNVSFDWATIHLLDFRRINIDLCEVLYGCKMMNILGAENPNYGKFISQNSNLELESYYERILSERIRPGFIFT